MSTESAVQHGRRDSSNDFPDAAQWQRWLPKWAWYLPVLLAGLAWALVPREAQG